MAGIRRASDLGTQGIKTILDGSIQTADIANNAITQAKLDTAIPLSGMRNAIINGSFDVWQRSTDLTTTVSAGTVYYPATDRWWITQLSTAGNVRMLRQLSDTGNLSYACRVQRPSGQTATGAIYFGTTLESIDSRKFAGQQITLSFSVKKGANSPNTFTVALYSGTGTDQSTGSLFSSGWTSGTNIISQTVTPTTSMVRYTYTATVGSSANQLTLWFNWTPSGTAGADDWFQFEGIQLEVGSQTTPFERRSYQVELALCQRYYWRHTSRTNDGVLAAGGVFYTSTSFFTGLFFPVAARTSSPTAGASSGSALEVVVNGTVVNSSAITAGDTTAYSAQLVITTASTTAGQGGCVRASGANDYLYMENEL